jgi:hypothetical protein
MVQINVNRAIPDRIKTIKKNPIKANIKMKDKITPTTV